MLRFWAAGKRAAYNEALKFFQRHTGKPPYWSGVKTKIIRQLPKCYKDVPYQVKGDAVREAWQAVTNAKKKKKKLGGSKIITAENGTSMHRDLNGARGILVRFLTWIHALRDEACHA